MTEPTIDWGDLPYRAAILLQQQRNGTITAEGQAELASLLDEPTRVRLLAGLEDDDALEARLSRLARFNSDTAWQKVLHRRQAIRKQQKARRYWYAAAAIATIAFGTWLLTGRQSADNNARIVADNRFGHDNDVLPGTSRAELILSNGRTVQLQGNDFSLEEEDGTRLKADSGSIRYDALPASGSETLFNTLRVPVAGTYRLVLPDGTVVWLNSASELKFPVRFTGSQRMVELRGEGFFDVAADAQKPFSVNVNNDTIRVLGTEFNISAYDPARTTTVLLSGKVAVAGRRGQKSLAPGQQAVSTTSAVSVSPADPEKATAWKNGYFYFSNDSVAEIMEQLSRWFGVTVRYEGTIARGMHIGGTISRDASLGEVLEQLQLISGLRFRISGSELIVSAPQNR